MLALGECVVGCFVVLWWTLVLSCVFGGGGFGLIFCFVLVLVWLVFRADVLWGWWVFGFVWVVVGLVL